MADATKIFDWLLWVAAAIDFAIVDNLALVRLDRKCGTTTSGRGRPIEHALHLRRLISFRVLLLIVGEHIFGCNLGLCASSYEFIIECLHNFHELLVGQEGICIGELLGFATKSARFRTVLVDG